MTPHFDEMITSPARLAILAALVPGSPVRFSDMKAATGLADGNLHVQANKLAAAGYIRIEKSRHRRRSVTEFRLTGMGLERLELHVMKLNRIMDGESADIRRAAPSGRPDDSAVWS